MIALDPTEPLIVVVPAVVGAVSVAVYVPLLLFVTALSVPVPELVSVTVPPLALRLLPRESLSCTGDRGRGDCRPAVMLVADGLMVDFCGRRRLRHRHGRRVRRRSRRRRNRRRTSRHCRRDSRASALPIVTTAVLFDDQVTAPGLGAAIESPRAFRTLARKFCVAPNAEIVVVPDGTTVSDAGAFETVTLIESATSEFPGLVALMYADPAPVAVTRPADDTVATV